MTVATRKRNRLNTDAVARAVKFFASLKHSTGEYAGQPFHLANWQCERIISRMVVSGADVTEEDADKIYQKELKRVSWKFTHMRYHSFLMYFGVLKRLGWVESAGQTEASAVQDNYPPAPERTYYRLTRKGIEAGDELWSNPLFTLYPEIGPSHMKRQD